MSQSEAQFTTIKNTKLQYHTINYKTQLQVTTTHVLTTIY